MKKFCLFVIALLSLASCQQEEIATNGMYDDAFMSKLKFKTADLVEKKVNLKNESDQTAQFTGDKKEIKMNSNSGNLDLMIFSVRIARPSTECKRGFGFCDFVWFPKKPKKDIQIQLNQRSYSSFVIKSDENGNKFVDLELAEEPTGIDISKLQPLIVEGELEGFNNVNNEEKEIIISQGSYPFDNSVGEFGGYRIPLK